MIAPDEAQTPRVCQHGQLARQCEICDLQRELAATKALVKEWACEKCRTVYPGPPQKGFMCVICPACKGNTMPHELLNHREELAAAKAEAAAMENNWMCAEEKASRREAEAEALRATIGDSLEVMDSMIRAMHGNADCEVVVSMMKGYAERANKRVADALPPIGQNRKVCEKTHISGTLKEEQ